jgi:hypothetical protein
MCILCGCDDLSVEIAVECAYAHMPIKKLAGIIPPDPRFTRRGRGGKGQRGWGKRVGGLSGEMKEGQWGG